MSTHFHDSASDHEAPPTLAERRQRLAVLCALDRAQLRLVLRPRSVAATSFGGTADGLQTALGAARFLPGKLGVWARRAGVAASLFRLLR